VIHELRRRLAEYRLMEKKLHNKYNMAFEEFKSKKMVEESGILLKLKKIFVIGNLRLTVLILSTMNLRELQNIHETR